MGELSRATARVYTCPSERLPLRLKMSHCPLVRSQVTLVRYLSAFVRLRLCYKPGLRHLGQLGPHEMRNEMAASRR